MASTTRNWLTGCGIGCGLILIVLGAVGTCGYLGVRKIIDKADGLEEGFAALDAEFGPPGDFTPDPSGAIPPDRMEAFLEIRSRMTPLREEVSAIFRTLDGKENQDFLDKAKAGFKLVPSIMEFIAERNRIALEVGMGVGEYQHVYCLAYYGLLGKDPADGPGFTLHSDDEGDGEVQFGWKGSGEGKDEEDVRRERVRELRRMVNKVQRAILANQLQALEGRDPAHPEDEAWRNQLEAEVGAMKAEYLRLPWETGLPDRIGESLEPYRSALEATYDPMTSILEMGLVDPD